MATDRLQLERVPQMTDAVMVLSFSGWMDGGGVSTATVEWLTQTLVASRFGTLHGEGFYVESFPAPMEVATMLRPHVKIVDGMVRQFTLPGATISVAPSHRLILFQAREPNCNWEAFADAVFSVAKQTGVRTMYFIGSVGGAVPHTRRPPVNASVSDMAMKKTLEPLGAKFANYEGPASFATYLLARAPRHGIAMANLIVEIPAYVHSANPKCVEAAIRLMCALLSVRQNLDELRTMSDDWEKRLSGKIEDHPDLAGHIAKLEANYDNDVFDQHLGDLKSWLEERGIRVD
jgi:hypothetical protein